MWVARAGAQLLFHVAVAVVIALCIAVVLALVHGGGLRHAFAIACWSVGGLLVLLGAVGHSPTRQRFTTAGRMPGLPATLQLQPGDTTLSTSAVFFLTAGVLFVIAVVSG